MVRNFKFSGAFFIAIFSEYANSEGENSEKFDLENISEEEFEFDDSMVSCLKFFACHFLILFILGCRNERQRLTRRFISQRTL